MEILGVKARDTANYHRKHFDVEAIVQLTGSADERFLINLRPEGEDVCEVSRFGSVEEGKEFSACKFFWRESWSDLRKV